ncbi:MAG: hypothetical protein HGA77_11255 [Chlorobiaceae bacterium]|nr:hypothetical protein [Chlorobiaceae bacterium]
MPDVRACLQQLTILRSDRDISAVWSAEVLRDDRRQKTVQNSKSIRQP